MMLQPSRLTLLTKLIYQTRLTAFSSLVVRTLNVKLCPF